MTTEHENAALDWLAEIRARLSTSFDVPADFYAARAALDLATHSLRHSQAGGAVRVTDSHVIDANKAFLAASPATKSVSWEAMRAALNTFARAAAHPPTPASEAVRVEAGVLAEAARVLRDYEIGGIRLYGAERAGELADALFAAAAAIAEPVGEKVDDPAEAAYWDFDARRKGYGIWSGLPMSERDAFKAEYRLAQPTAIPAGDSLLREPSAPLPQGCYCQPGRCMAPRIMGRQQPCRDPAKAAAPKDGAK